MSSRKHRLNEMANLALPPKGSPFWDMVKCSFEKDMKKPEVRLKIERLWELATATAWAQDRNGAGYCADEAIREFVRDYNQRVQSYGLVSMPLSWNVAEAFVRYRPDAIVFELLPEIDHRISFEDFFDWFTKPGQDADVSALNELIEEDVVYSFSGLGDPAQVVVEALSGSFGIASLSLVRSGAEIAALCVVGRVGGFEDEAQRLVASEVGPSTVPGKEGLAPDPSLMRQVVTLDATTPMWRHVVLARLDLEAKAFQVRYVLRDLGNSFDVMTDDPTMMLGVDGNPVSSDAVDLYEKVRARLPGYDAVFDAVKALLCLPCYLHAYESMVVESRVVTKLMELAKDPEHERLLGLVPKRRHNKTRRIATLLPQSVPQRISERVIEFPAMSVARSGFWKILGPGIYGLDKSGQPIQGKSWVERSDSWVEVREPSQLVLKTGSGDAVADSATSGWIYVMRSPMHPGNVFKIGMTRRSVDVRASELSGTASPDQLFVMHRWKTVDCARAEKVIHEALRQQRLNPNREFFAVDFEYATRVISEVVEAMRIEGGTSAAQI